MNDKNTYIHTSASLINSGTQSTTTTGNPELLQFMNDPTTESFVTEKKSHQNNFNCVKKLSTPTQQLLRKFHARFE